MTPAEVLELAEEAVDAAGLLLADAVAEGIGDVGLLRGEYLRTKREVDVAWAVLEARGLGLAS